MTSTATSTEAVSCANHLLATHTALISHIRSSQQLNRRRLRALNSPPIQLLNLPTVPSPPPYSPSPPPSPVLTPKPKHHRMDLPPAKRARVVRYQNYVPEEETIRNDYSQRYVDGGEWPQNWVLGAEPEHRFEEYPKQQRLLNLKKVAVASHCLPSSYLPFSSLSSLMPCKFDVILLDPPYSSSFTWEHLQELPIPGLAADPSFIFMWVGSGAGEGLERGREVLAKWGYRRCEDVVWVKTNKTTNCGPGTDPPTTSLLTRTKQHCLIGIRGTVRRSTDSWFVHCNVDTDVIIWEGDPSDPTLKPPEMYTLIENFCLGTRRLEVFGRAPTSLRRGWVTVFAEGCSRNQHYGDGIEGGTSAWDKDSWESGIKALANGGKCVVPMTTDIDALRPKSPFRPGTAGGGAGGTSGGTPMGIGMGNSRTGQPSGGNRNGFGNAVTQTQGGGFSQGQNQMMVPSMMGMGMNTLGGLGIGVREDGVPGMVGWPGMMGVGNMGIQGMGNIAGMMGMGPQLIQMGATASEFQGQGLGGTFGLGGFNGGQILGTGMAWHGMGGDQGQQQFMENQGLWDGVDGMMGMGMGNAMGMNAMGGMGMGYGWSI